MPLFSSLVAQSTNPHQRHMSDSRSKRAICWALEDGQVWRGPNTRHTCTRWNSGALLLNGQEKRFRDCTGCELNEKYGTDRFRESRKLYSCVDLVLSLLQNRKVVNRTSREFLETFQAATTLSPILMELFLFQTICGSPPNFNVSPQLHE